MNQFKHIPVLLKESIDFLFPKQNGIYVDATLGGAGHSLEILKRTDGKAKLIGIDQDEDAIRAAEQKINGSGYKSTIIKGNFANIKEILEGSNIPAVDGILFDLGISSYQIETPERGFGLRTDGPLDMRMDRSLGTSAEDLVNQLEALELKKIIKEFGEERFAGRIANAIVREREKIPIKTTFQLKGIIEKALPPSAPQKKLNSVTRTFQALRIEVNAELENLKRALNDSIDLLKKHGRIVVISYHSLEDRIVKDKFRLEAKDCVCPPKFPKCVCDHEKRLNILTKKPVQPGEAEIEKNPRSRSAKLRAAERI